jgi:hypothetical protein
MEESNLTQAIRHLGAGKTNDDLHEFFAHFRCSNGVIEM